MLRPSHVMETDPNDPTKTITRELTEEEYAMHEAAEEQINLDLGFERHQDSGGWHVSRAQESKSGAVS